MGKSTLMEPDNNDNQKLNIHTHPPKILQQKEVKKNHEHGTRDSVTNIK